MKGHKQVGQVIKEVAESKPRVRGGADPLGVAVDRVLASWDLATKALNGLTAAPKVGGQDREQILGLLGAYVALGPKVAHRLETHMPESAHGKIEARGMAIHEEITDDARDYAIEGESRIAGFLAEIGSGPDGLPIADLLSDVDEEDDEQTRPDAACKGGCPAPSLDRQ